MAAQRTLTGDEIVISGLSGNYPKSKNASEFMENLFNKVDMVSKIDRELDHPEIPEHAGKIEGTDRFDPQFFSVTYKQAITLDPMARLLMENAYAAMYDSGVNPLDYKRKRIGVFIGTTFSDSSYDSLYIPNKINPFFIMGASATMYANRISYWLDSNGPSYSVTCTSAAGLLCLEHAYKAMNEGLCEAALVGASQLCVNQLITLNYGRRGVLCFDGKTKCFDQDGDGYVRSEAISLLFLQKAKDAKRVYAQVCNIKQKYSLDIDTEYLPIRNHKEITNFLTSFYKDLDMDLNKIEYVEANGVARADADANELEAVGDVFGKESPVMVGCVKSNMGHSEPASGICSLTKLCLAYHRGELPGNLHYKRPLNIDAIKNGKVQVLTKNTSFNRTFTAVNNFSEGGVNFHVLLNGCYKPKDLQRYKSNIPRLVPIAGRDNETLENKIDILKNQPFDPEMIGLLHNIYKTETPGFTSRGYVILKEINSKETESVSQSTKHYDGVRRPLWLVFSGMGSQWAGMGAELMNVPVFAAAIEKCHKVLEPLGIDIIRVITERDESIFDNILNCFVGIAAVQIGLSDILKQIGLVPDGIIGHSVGEIGCAYFDGCLTAEQMILAAYARGIVSVQTDFIRGSMAAVGLGYKDLLPICSPDIDIACHNSFNSATISGPADEVEKFVSKLKSKGIFAREVKCANIAYHSRYIRKAGDDLQRRLNDVIKKPVLRSNKWVCSSLLQENWSDPIAKYSSAEYFTNNLLNPVYFEESGSLIDSNAVVVEVAPHGLLQAILKKSHSSCVHIPLTKRDHADPVNFFLDALGKIYQEGLNLNAAAMYPKIEFPVSTETPLLSQLVQWYHKEKWPTSLIQHHRGVARPARGISLLLEDSDYKFGGFIKEGQHMLPEAAMLLFVWETLAAYKGIQCDNLSVVLRNINFHQQAMIRAEDPLHINIDINPGNGYFEVVNETVLICSGYIHEVKKPKETWCKGNVKFENDFVIQLNSDDIYQILYSKGHYYRDDFQSIVSASFMGASAQIIWKRNWISFLDSFIQLNILANSHNGLSVTKLISSVTIDANKHKRCVDLIQDGGYLEATIELQHGVTRCGGVEFRHIVLKDMPIVEEEPDVLRDTSFVSNNQISVEGQADKYLPMTKLYNGEINFCLTNTTPLDGNSYYLQWSEVPDPIGGDRNVQVCYAGLSTMDVEKAVEMDNDKNRFGMDFSGYNNSGEKLMGLMEGGALSSLVQPDPDLLWPVPDHWTLEEAVTVPLPYAQAYYCLMIKVKVQPQQSIFITDGAKPLGQALISIGLSLGCTVYTSVINSYQKQFLVKKFHMDENNIAYTDDGSFYEMIVHNTKNRRCHFVINDLSGPLRDVALKCVNKDGCFLDLSNADLKQNKIFGMYSLDPYKNYYVVDLATIFRPEYSEDKKTLKEYITDGIARGVVKPLDRKVYSLTDVTEAFQQVTLNENHRRVLVHFSDDKAEINVSPRMACSSHEIYVVICDGTSLGLEVANRLIKKGARKLVLNLPSKNLNGYCHTNLKLWYDQGVAVKLSSESLYVREECARMIEKMKKFGQVAGVFIVNKMYGHNASSCTQKEFQRNEVETIVNLDHLTRNNYPELRHFLVLSRVPRCGADEAVLAATEQVCRQRTQDGLPGLAVTASIQEYGQPQLSLNKISPQKINTVLNAMEISMKQNYNRVLTYNINKEFISGEQLYKFVGALNASEIGDDRNITEAINGNTSLEDVKVLLKLTNGIEFTDETVKKITLSSVNAKFETGLGAFYKFVGRDDLLETEKCILLRSMRSKSDEKEIEIDPSDHYLMLIPGFDGHHGTFSSLCEKLKIKTLVFRAGPDLSTSSVSEIAQDIKKAMMKRLKLTEKFYLLGYSFGVVVALEVAALLEKEGLEGVVYCLDSGPDVLQKQLNAYVGPLTDEQLQDAVINHISNLMTRRNQPIIEEEMSTMKWADKVTICVNILQNLIQNSHIYIKEVLETAYRRISLVKTYSTDLVLKSKIILLKGVPHPNAEELPLDYNLTKYTKHPVKIFNITTDVVSAPNDLTLPHIINQSLDSKILEDFRTKKLCDTYNYLSIST